MNGFIKFLKVIFYIAFFGFIAFGLYGLIDAKNTDLANPDDFQSFGLVYALLMVYGLIGFGALFVVGLIALICSLASSHSFERSKNIKSSVLMMILPFVGEIIIYVAGLII